MQIQDYLNRITSAYQGKPNFTAVVSLLVSLPVQIQTVLASLVTLYDVDSATGVQLDIIGQWVGISRNIAVPISGVYFSFDGADYTVGWDYGTWQPFNAPTEVTSLPDDAYRTLIRTKIAANHWDGTTPGAYAIWDSIFTNFTILIQDNQNMTYGLAIVGGIVDSLTLALLSGGYIPLKPEGIEISEYFVSTDTNPAFGWDVESSSLGGWDQGSWLREILPT
jgi:hypothetical protein